MRLPHFAITLIAVVALSPVVVGEVSGPYAADANTLALFHFDELPGTLDPGNPFLNFGTLGSVLDLTNTGGPDGRDNTGAGGYGGTSFTGFGSSFNVLASGTGTYHTGAFPTGGGATTAGAVTQGSLQGASGAFTYEAIIRLNGITDEQNILSHDGGSTRGFLFRALGGNMAFYNGATSITAPIPITGEHAFVAGDWFHVAITYTGDEASPNNTTFYWTALDSSATAANSIGTATLSADLAPGGSNLLGVGTTTRSGFRLEVAGLVDEVRLSDVARGANEFVFVPEPGTAALLGLGMLVMTARRSRRR